IHQWEDLEMKHPHTPLAIALAAAALATPFALEEVRHDGGQATRQIGGLATPPDRSDAAEARRAGSPPVVSPPAQVEATGGSDRAGLQSAVVSPPDRVDGATATGARPRPRPIVVGDGFDWTAAGVGFAAALGLGLLGTGSIATVRRRRQPPNRRPL